MDYLYFLQQLREGELSWLNGILLCISELGTALAIGMIISIYWAFNKQSGKRLIFGFTLSISITNFVKNCFCINRPWLLDSRLHVYEGASSSATGYSFPSGHSTTAASCFGGMTLILKNRIISFLLILLTFAVMFSRNWLGCHTLDDVSAGFSIGLTAAIISFLTFNRFEENSRRRLILFVSCTLLCAAAIIWLLIKSYPVLETSSGVNYVNDTLMKAEGVKNTGNLFGFILGWIIENRFIQFKNPESWKQKIIMILTGAVSTGIIFVILKGIALCLNVILAGFICHTGIFFWIVAGFPFVWKRCIIRLTNES